MSRFWRSIAFYGALIAGVALVSWTGAALAQGTVIPRTCSQVVSLTQGSAGTNALVGPGSVNSPTTRAQVTQNSGAGIQICGYTINGGASSTAGLEYGTQTTNPCDTGTTALTPAWKFGTGGGVLSDNADYFRGLSVPPGSTLCIVSTTAAAQVIVYYNNLFP